MLTPLHGKVAIVTGGSRGSGQAIAMTLARDGAAVVINYAARPESAEATVRQIGEAGGRAASVRADVARPESAGELFAAAERAFGQVDILVSNAGVAAVMPLTAIKEADY